MRRTEQGEAGPPDRMESLLRDFFADELGRWGIDVSGGGNPLESGSPSATPRNRRWWLPLTAAAVACILLGLWLASDGTVGDGGSSSQPLEVEEYLVINDDEFLQEEVYSTPDGAVAQSARLQWTTVSISDPLSGNRLDVAVPQLVIVIEAADGQGRRRQR